MKEKEKNRYMVMKGTARGREKVKVSFCRIEKIPEMETVDWSSIERRLLGESVRSLRQKRGRGSKSRHLQTEKAQSIYRFAENAQNICRYSADI